MAQHIKLGRENEPQVFKEAKNIGIDLVKNKFLFKNVKPFEYKDIFERSYKILPSEYKTDESDEYVVNIGGFNLVGFYNESETVLKDVPLMCHFNKTGEVVNIYLVV